jgi:hypothetical protein
VEKDRTVGYLGEDRTRMRRVGNVKEDRTVLFRGFI